MKSAILSLLIVAGLCISSASGGAQEDNNPYAGCKALIVGGGIGGIYAAHQLLNYSVFPAHQICIFEASHRPGGRIYSLRDDNGRLMADLGGASFVSGGNVPIMDSIVSAFNINTICEYYLNGCEDGDYYASIRNTPLVKQDKGTKKSSKLPYYLLPDEQYSTNEQYEATYPYNLLALQLEVDPQWIADLSSPNSNKAWRSTKKIFDYLTSNNVPMTNLTFANSDFRTALYNTTTGERIFFSEEKWASINDAVGGAEYDSYEAQFHVNKIGFYTGALFVDFSGGVKRYIADANGNPIGYSTPLEILLANFTNHGGRIFYNHQVASVRRPHPYDSCCSSDKFVIEGVVWNENRKGTPFKTRGTSAMLNLGVQDINRLSRDSVMWTESKFDFEYVLQSYGTTPALKGFLYYEDPWMLKLPSGRGNAFSTDEPIHFYEQTQSWFNCDVSEVPNCPVWTQYTYVDGLQYCAYWDSANLNRTSAPIWLDPNDVVTAPFLEDAHRQLVNVYRDQLVEAGIDPDSLALPTRGVLAWWEGGWSYTKTNDLNGRQNRMMRKPLNLNNNAKPGDALCIFNTDVSVAPGEANGSLQAALEALLLCYNLTVPNFPDTYYKNIISQVY